MKALQVTDSMFHATKPNNPKSLSRAWQKSLKSGKPGRCYGELFVDERYPGYVFTRFRIGNLADLPAIMAGFQEAMANPVFGHDVIEKMEAAKRRGTLDSDLVKVLEEYKQTH